MMGSGLKRREHKIGTWGNTCAAPMVFVFFFFLIIRN